MKYLQLGRTQNPLNFDFCTKSKRLRARETYYGYAKMINGQLNHFETFLNWKIEKKVWNIEVSSVYFFEWLFLDDFLWVLWPRWPTGCCKSTIFKSERGERRWLFERKWPIIVISQILETADFEENNDSYEFHALVLISV